MRFIAVSLKTKSLKLRTVPAAERKKELTDFIKISQLFAFIQK